LLQELLLDNNNQPLHEYWGEKVKIRRRELQGKTYIEAYKVRHEYTNYDQLINSIDLGKLEELEKSRLIAIIKYECTFRALQCVNDSINKSLVEAQLDIKKIEEDNKELKGWYKQLLAKIFSGKNENKLLEAKLKEREIEIISLKEKKQEDQVNTDYQKEINSWKKKFEDEQVKRIRLGRKNQSLGGRVSHAKKWKEERDLFNNLLDQEEIKNIQLSSELERTKRELTEYKVLKRNYENTIIKLRKKLDIDKN
tara:strand:- start:147 stop:905 length:759 start_codon:yes stop_codon:yes gene_type:complete